MSIETHDPLFELEAHYIGCLLKEPSLVDEAILADYQLTSSEHRKWLNTIRDFQKQGKILDLATIRTVDKDELARMGGRAYMAQMIGAVASVEAFKSYERSILNAYFIQQGKDIASDFMLTEQFAKQETLQLFFEQITRLEASMVNESEDFRSSVLKRVAEHHDSPVDGLAGIDTGFKVLNHVTEGWTKKDLIVVGGRPSIGKTLFGLVVLSKGMLADPDVYPTFISAEMPKGGVIDRLISQLGNIKLSKLRNFNKYLAKDDRDLERYDKTVNFLTRSPFHIAEVNKVPEIRAVMRKRMKEHPDKKHICCIDFLTQLRPVNPTGNANFDYGEIVLDLKQMAKDLDIPVILLVQLNRQNEQRQDKRPNMSDIRDTGTVEQAADIVAFVHREDYYNRSAEPTNIMELIFTKNRQGPLGTFNFKVDLETQDLHEIAR